MIPFVCGNDYCNFTVTTKLMNPDITVLIPVRNGARFVSQAIESVLSQTFPNFRLVVSDNCSVDATRDIVGNYLHDNRVSLVERPKDIGSIGNFNRCLGIISTKYYMLLCSDDMLWTSYALEKAHEVLERYPDVSSVYCDMAFVDEDSKIILTRRFAREGVIDSHRLALQCVRTSRNWFGIPLLTRSARVQGLQYDPATGYAVDVDFSIATTRGTAIYHIPELLIANRYHNENATLKVAGFARRHILVVADKHGIHLSRTEYWLMTLIYFVTLWKKHAFFLFLELKRKRKLLLHWSGNACRMQSQKTDFGQEKKDE